MSDEVRWERITRKLLVLASYGIAMEYLAQHVDEPGFLSDAWLEEYFASPLERYVLDELNAVDLLLSERAVGVQP